jgi:hypothetical protein
MISKRPHFDTDNQTVAPLMGFIQFDRQHAHRFTVTLGKCIPVIVTGYGLHMVGISWVSSCGVAYGIGALLFKVESKVSLGFALLLFILTAVLDVTHNPRLSATFAVATFYVLSIGVISTLLEFSKDKPLKNKK